jgi:hypothetical protein
MAAVDEPGIPLGAERIPEQRLGPGLTILGLARPRSIEPVEVRTVAPGGRFRLAGFGLHDRAGGKTAPRLEWSLRPSGASAAVELPGRPGPKRSTCGSPTHIPSRGMPVARPATPAR